MSDETTTPTRPGLPGLPAVIDAALADPLVCGWYPQDACGQPVTQACCNCREGAAMKLAAGWTVDQVLASIEAYRDQTAEMYDEQGMAVPGTTPGTMIASG